MLRLYDSLPKEQIYVAVSGGIDSMVLADFIVRGGRKPIILHINHGTEYANKAEEFVINWARERDLTTEVSPIYATPPAGQSKEEFWRGERYAFFTCRMQGTILLGHHLNDAVETWVFSSLHGTPSLIQYRHANCIRPLLLTSRSEIEQYTKAKQVKYIEDPSNTNTDFMRNHIRHNLMPGIKKVNPGIEKMIFKKLKDRSDKEKRDLRSRFLSNTTITVRGLGEDFHHDHVG